MKRSHFLIFSFLFLFIGSSVAQKKYIAPADAPEPIQTFVSKHFPEGQIAYLKKKEKLHYTKYEVKLDTGVELEFDQDFKIFEIEAKSALPASVIPSKIQEYVSKTYPNRTIHEWKLTKRGQKIELDNDLDLLFDRSGNFIKVD